MNKGKKLLALLASLILTLALTSCGYERIEISIDQSGKSEVYGLLGFTEDALKTIVMYSGGDLSDLGIEDFEYFVVDGKEYYGVTDGGTFSSIEEFNKEFQNAAVLDIGQTPNSELYTGFIWIDDSDPNKWVLTVGPAAIGGYEQYGEDLSDMYDGYTSDVIQLLVFNLPGKITQIIGDGTGVTIDNNQLTVDFAKVSRMNSGELVFQIDIDNSITVKSPSKHVHFNDVRLGSWYFDAVDYAANAGIISGYGDFKFGPSDTLTIAQFSQIIYNYKGMTSTGSNGYWATEAIQSAINSNIIKNHGDINSKNYDVAITREEAIAGLAIAMKNIEAKYSYTISDIADNKDISDEFKDSIVMAFNIGITSGVDSNKTFLPKRSLTRAELCQLLYNVSK